MFFSEETYIILQNTYKSSLWFYNKHKNISYLSEAHRVWH